MSLVFALAALTSTALAQPPTLKVGDAAPPLTLSKWVKGTPVSSFENGKTYVVEFWATWCGPCRRVMPHLTELQAKHPDVDVVAVSVWEVNWDRVDPFVKANDAKMGYSVAVDQLDQQPAPDLKQRGKWSHDHGKMSEDWLIASGWDNIGIPAAFIVDKEGKVAWIGDSNEIDQPLDQILTGTWDLQKAQDANAEQLGECNARAALQKSIQQAVGEKDYARAAQLEQDFIEAKPAERFDLYGDLFELQLVNEKKPDDAYATAEKALPYSEKDYISPLPQIVHAIAYETPEGMPVNTELGLRLGHKADQVANGQRANVKQALAKLSYDIKNYPDAVKYQQAAIDLLPNGDKSEYEKELATYRTAAGG